MITQTFHLILSHSQKMIRTQFFLSYKSIFYRLFNPIAFEESDFNHGEDILYLKQLINSAITKTIYQL